MIYVLKEERITPVCAGSTHIWHQAEAHGRDHPRLRGEYHIGKLCTCCVIGSPPLARGVLCLDNCNTIIGRITPACAGSTFTALAVSTDSKDHPRLRGEYDGATV